MNSILVYHKSGYGAGNRTPVAILRNRMLTISWKDWRNKIQEATTGLLVSRPHAIVIATTTSNAMAASHPWNWWADGGARTLIAAAIQCLSHIFVSCPYCRKMAFAPVVPSVCRKIGKSMSNILPSRESFSLLTSSNRMVKWRPWHPIPGSTIGSEDGGHFLLSVWYLRVLI